MSDSIRKVLAAMVGEIIPFDDGQRRYRDAVIKFIAESAVLAEVERQRDNFKEGYRRAIDAVDQVFQECRENPNPILPDFLSLGSDKFEGVIRLAKEYKQQAAELTALRAENERLRRMSHN